MSDASPTLNLPTPAAAPALPDATPAPKPSDWSPLRNPVFRSLWIASAISYTGFEIRNYAAPLLMVDFKSHFRGVSDGMAAYTFTASTLPIPLLVLFAGALADIVDRRKLLIVTHLYMLVVAGLLGVLTIMNLMTPTMMLGFLFVLGAGYAMTNPALLAVLPELVQPSEIRSALALNSVNMNIARVAGPAIGGVIVGLFMHLGTQRYYIGKGAAFFATGVSMVGVVWVLLNWKPAERKKAAHPESILGAVRSGLRYTRHSPRLSAILARVFLFMFCAGVLQTFSGIICKKNPATLHGDAGASVLMIFMGVGAILGVLLMQPLQRRFGIEETVAVSTLLFGLAQLGVAKTPNLYLGSLAMFVAGFNWVIVPTNFNISTQVSVPMWIKGRAMGMYVLVLWGGMSAGSAVWGRVMSAYGPRVALEYAAYGVLIGTSAIAFLRLVPRVAEDYTPHKPGPLPPAENADELAAGPVWVAVDYRVERSRLREFHAAARALRAERLRNGATDWRLSHADGVTTEWFEFPSWTARARHHDRVTKGDAALEARVMALHAGETPPVPRYAASAPEPEVEEGGGWLTHVTAGIGREVVEFSHRMERARARDQYREAWKHPNGPAPR